MDFETLGSGKRAENDKKRCKFSKKGVRRRYFGNMYVEVMPRIGRILEGCMSILGKLEGGVTWEDVCSSHATRSSNEAHHVREEWDLNMTKYRRITDESCVTVNEY